MSRQLPLVEAGLLFDPTAPSPPICLDTPAWVAWLERPSTTRFTFALIDPVRGYIIGYLTVRKERRQRGGAYWTAYRRVGRLVRKSYLGPAAAVTHARLAAVAAALHPAPGGIGAATAGPPPAGPGP